MLHYALFLHVFQVLLLIPLQALHQRCFPVIHYISSGSHYSLPYAFQQSCSLPHCRLCHNKGAVSPARFHILYYSYLINPFFYFQSGPMISYSGPVLSFSKYHSNLCKCEFSENSQLKYFLIRLRQFMKNHMNPQSRICM